MPSEALTRPHWVARVIQQWPATHTVERVPYDEVLAAIRSLPRGAYQGVAVGEHGGSQAFLFLINSRICGVRVTEGELRGRDAISHLARVCQDMTWTFRQATEQFCHLVPIMASLVGEGGKQLVRQVEPVMSAHLQALADLEKDPTAYLIVERTDSSQMEWILFSGGPGEIHRIGVSDAGVELPTHKGLDAATLMTVFRRQKATDELYRVDPRYFSDELLASLVTSEAVPAEAHASPPHSSMRKQGTSALVYLLPLLFVVLLWGGWMLWARAVAHAPSDLPGQARPALAVPIATEREVVSGNVGQLLEEVASLRSQIASLRTSHEAPAAGAYQSDSGEQPEKPARPTSRRTQGGGIDSLVRRISYLEGMIRHQREDQPAPSKATDEVRLDTSGDGTSVGQVHPPDTAVRPPDEAPPLSVIRSTEEAMPVREPASAAPPSAGSGEIEAHPPPAVQPRAYAEALVDTPPRVLSSPPPAYPSWLRSRQIEGNVLVSILVGADGNVQQVVPLRGHKELRPLAAESVGRWRYQPAILDGAEVPCWTTALITFRVR